MLLYDIGQPHPCLAIGCDNQAALVLIHNPITSLRAKHIEVHHHIVREKVEEGKLSFSYVPTAANTADILTKIVEVAIHRECILGLGMQ